MITRAKNSPGFTLVEVMVSVVIGGLILTAALTILWQTIDMSKRINSEYTALNLAKSRLERVRAVIGTSGFASLPALSETTGTEIDGVFKRFTTVTVNYLGNSRLTQVDVKIVYRHGGEWREGTPVTMTTVFVNTE